MIGQQHIIRKQNLKVSAVSDDPFALKQRVVSLMERLTPRLSDVFDGVTKDGEWLKIDTLDIVVDGIAEHELEDKLLGKLLDSIKEQLNARKQDIVSGAGVAENDLFVSVHHKTILALAYFLEHGIMPWWMPVNDHLAFEEAIIEALAFYLSSNADARARRVYIGLQERLRVNAGRSRLLEQFSETVYLQVICWVAANDNSEKVADLREAFLEVAGIFGAYTAKKPVALIWDKAKVSLLDKLLRPANAGKAISYWLIDVWSDLARYDETVLIRGFLSLTIATKYLPDVVRDRRGNSSLKPADVPGDKHEDDETMTNDEPAKRKKKGTKKQRGVVDDALNDDSAKDARQLSESPMDKDGAIVANAGLILVAPFLPELFRQCKVVKGKQIKNYNKAIAITHYIAHGNCNYREYDVLLNKLLCGVDEHMTIRILKTLSKSDRNEIDTMLTSLIAHWSVLGSTSVAGLREGFLMRHGKLVSKYDEWFLVVERSPIDVLVQQIPWTIGMVKLPWMKKMIKTEWV